MPKRHRRLTTAALLAGLALAAWLWPRGGLVLEVEAVGRDGSVWRARTMVEDVRAEDVERLRPPLAVSARARWSGVLFSAETGQRHLRLRARGDARLRIDGTPWLEVRGGDPDDGAELRRSLSAGPHDLELTWEVPSPARRLRLREDRGAGFVPLRPESLYPHPPTGAVRVLVGAGRIARVAAPWLAAIALAALVVAGWRGRPWGLRPATLAGSFRGRRGRALLAAVVLLVVAYAGALRFEALIHSFWDTHEWRWTEPWRPALVSLKPDSLRWSEESPIVGGDPMAYLWYGRHLRDFYEERVREPLFVYATHVALRLTGDHPVGVGLASAFFSTLCVLGIYLVGAEAFSRGAGLVAALAFAIERDAIWWGIQGWRDDAFACFVVFFALAALRFDRRGGAGDMVLLALAGGAAWLTRITSLTFLIPGVAYLAWSQRRAPDRRDRWRRLAIAAGLIVAMMLPFLLTCWIALGDPFYAINEYTSFFRERSGHQDARPLNVVEFLLAFRPFEMLDKAFIGYTWHPFAQRWNYEDWSPVLGPLLAAAALVGLFVFPFLPAGRLLLVVHVSAMLPFLWGWDVREGSPWRHTLHAYPFYLLASGFVLDGVARLLASSQARSAARGWSTRPRLLAMAGLAAALAVATPALAHGLHYYRTGEAIRTRPEPQYVMAGPRDALFFGEGWHSRRYTWNWYTRLMAATEGVVHLPLAAGPPYRLTLRVDPFVPDPARRQRVAVSLNGAPLAVLTLRYDPARTGEYVVEVPAQLVRDGSNRLELRAARVDPARELKQRPPDVPEDWEASLELRYVRVERLDAGGTGGPDSAVLE